MSILTKVFVVLLVVLSIAFASTTVSIVAQTANWKDTAEKYRENARIADTNLRHEIAASSALLATARDEVQAHLTRIGELEAQLQASRNEVAQLRSELAAMASEKSSAEAINRGLLAQLQTAETGRAQYRTQRDELEKRNIDLEQRNIDMSDRVNELTARIDVLLEQKRQFEQQLHILRSENEKLAQASGRVPAGAALEAPEGAAMSGVVAQTPIPARAIRGEVVDLSGDLVTISVGRTDGVKQDMVFVIHRGGEYIGDVRITVVDPDRSAGRLLRSQSPPRRGDQVTDAVWLSGSRG